MRLLIDTHALLWWFADDPALGPRSRADPFDRMLIAQALEKGLTVLTSDARFAEYGVPVLAA